RWILGPALACSLAGAWSDAAAEPASYFPRECNTVSYRTAPGLQAQRACMNLEVKTHGTQTGTYLFLSPGGTFGTGAGIFTDRGALVWWQPAISKEESDISVVRYHGHRYLAVWSGKGAFDDPDGKGTVSLYNEH